jgi:hypothetical protein
MAVSTPARRPSVPTLNDPHSATLPHGAMLKLGRQVFEEPSPVKKVVVDSSINRDQAERLIRENGFEKGTYVIRESSTNPGSFVLCVCSPTKTVLHFPMEAHPPPGRGFTLLNEVQYKNFDSLEAILEFCASPAAEGIVTRLTKRLA